MSTCDVIDTEDWQGAGIDTIGAGGFGVLGSQIAASGDDGPGYAFDDLEPGDASKEICGRITNWPTIGTLYAYEDTSFTYTRPDDGADSFQYQLYADGIAIGVPQTVTLIVGAVAANAPGATMTGLSSLAGGAATGAAAGAAPGAAFTGAAAIIAGAATGGQSAIAPGATLIGLSVMQAGAASGTGAASAPGATFTAAATLVAGTANGSSVFARAPAGAGYAPQRVGSPGTELEFAL